MAACVQETNSHAADVLGSVAMWIVRRRRFPCGVF